MKTEGKIMEMQKQETDKIVTIASLDATIPKTSSMIKVGSLFKDSDKAFMKDNHIGTVGVQVGQEYFFLSELHSVPDTAKLARTESGQVVGIPAIVAG